MNLRRIEQWPPMRLALKVKRRAGEDGTGALADALTYQGFVALFPLLLLGISVVGFLIAGGDAGPWISGLAAAVPGLDQLAGDAIRAIVRHREEAGLIGLAGLAWRGVGLVEAAGLALGRVFRVPPYAGLLRKKAWAVGSLLGLGGLALGAAGASAWAAGFEGWGAAIGGVGLALVLDLALFLLAYRLLVQRRGPALSRLWAGAVLAAVIWGVLKLVGALLAGWSASSAAGIYGPFAAIIGLLFVLRLGATAFLLGAELNAVLIERAARRGEPALTPAERSLARSS